MEERDASMRECPTHYYVHMDGGESAERLGTFAVPYPPQRPGGAGPSCVRCRHAETNGLVGFDGSSVRAEQRICVSPQILVPVPIVPTVKTYPTPSSILIWASPGAYEVNETSRPRFRDNSRPSPRSGPSVEAPLPWRMIGDVSLSCRAGTSGFAGGWQGSARTKWECGVREFGKV